jgi:hypothetical protein
LALPWFWQWVLLSTIKSSKLNVALTKTVDFLLVIGYALSSGNNNNNKDDGL